MSQNLSTTHVRLDDLKKNNKDTAERSLSQTLVTENIERRSKKRKLQNEWFIFDNRHTSSIKRNCTST